MDCPKCKTEIGTAGITVERSAEEDGIEINLVCPLCRREFFAVLQPENFEEVD
jgi:uncharacterized protein YbaR (Trm112 family)